MRCKRNKCKHKAEENRCYCKVHLQYIKDYQRERRASRNAAGVCTECSKPRSLSSKRFCGSCVERYAKNTAKHVKRFRERNLCLRCHQTKDAHGTSQHCRSCADIINQQLRKKYIPRKRVPKPSEGHCKRCKSEITENGTKSFCSVCVIKRRAYRQRKREQLKQEKAEFLARKQ